MTLIRPCADLRNNYNEISKICHETKQPVFITKNGTSDLVILSDEAYDSIKNIIEEKENERINKLISKYFDKHYSTFEEFQKDIYNKLESALNSIEEGKGIDMDLALTKLEEKYHLND